MATDYEAIRQRVLNVYRNPPEQDDRDPELVELTKMLAEAHAEISINALRGMNDKKFPLGVMLEGLVMVSGSAIRNVIMSAPAEYRAGMISDVTETFARIVDPSETDGVTIGDRIKHADYKAN